MSVLLKYHIFIIGLIVLSDCFTTSVFGKRGCSSFGHSCYGGHGKRSRGIDSPYTALATASGIANGLTTNKYFNKHHSKTFTPHFSNEYETLYPSSRNLKSLLKKLVTPLHGDHRLHSGTQYLEDKYYNF